MTVDVLTEIIIFRNIQQVSAYAANPDHAPEWYVNIKSAVWKTPKPLAVGSQIAFIAHFLGRKLSYTYLVNAYIPNEKLVMKTAEGPFPMETIYTWIRLDDNTTKMTLQNRGTPKGFSTIFAPLMSKMMRRANQKDLTLLKKRLESL